MLCCVVFGGGCKDIFTVSSFWDSSGTGMRVCAGGGGGEGKGI